MKNIYLYDTHTLYGSNNELYLVNDTHTIVINIDSFIHDLPSIVTICKKEYNKSNKELFKRLEKSLKND